MEMVLPFENPFFCIGRLSLWLLFRIYNFTYTSLHQETDVFVKYKMKCIPTYMFVVEIPKKFLVDTRQEVVI